MFYTYSYAMAKADSQRVMRQYRTKKWIGTWRYHVTLFLWNQKEGVSDGVKIAIAFIGIVAMLALLTPFLSRNRHKETMILLSFISASTAVFA